MNRQEKINGLARDLAPYHRFVSIALSEDQTVAMVYIPFLDIADNGKPKVLATSIPHDVETPLESIYDPIVKFIKMARPLLLQFIGDANTQLNALNVIEVIVKTIWCSAEVSLLCVNKDSITPTRFSAIITTPHVSFKESYFFNNAKKLDRLLVFLNEYHRHDLFWAWGKMSGEFPAAEAVVKEFISPQLESESSPDTGVEVTKPFDLSQLTIAVNKGDKTLATIDTAKAIDYLALLQLIDEAGKLGNNVSWYICGGNVNISGTAKLNNVGLSLTLNNNHTIDPRQVFSTIADWLADESIIFVLLLAVVLDDKESIERLRASMAQAQIADIRFKTKLIYRENAADEIPF